MIRLPLSLFFIVSLVKIYISKGAYKCNYDLYLRSCTGNNSGTECTPNNVLQNGKCSPRYGFVFNCVQYKKISESAVGEDQQDPGCLGCTDGRYLFVNKTEYTNKVAITDPNDANRKILQDQSSTYYYSSCDSGSNSVDNCKWPFTYNSTSTSPTAADYCFACDENFIPDITSHSGSEYYDSNWTQTKFPKNLANAFKKCTDSTSGSIANCAYTGLTRATNTTPTIVCYACKEGFVLDNAGTACVTYTEDINCMQVDANSKCKKCWWPFWFQQDICLRGYLMSLGNLACFMVIMFWLVLI